MKIWHQSFTNLDDLPAYSKAIETHVRKVVRPDTEVVLHGVRPGTYSTDYPGTDIGFASLYALHGQQWLTQGLAAQDAGFDAYAMCTLPNPMIREVRSVIDLPVVGYGEACFHLACMLGHRFGLLIFIDRMVPLYQEQIGLYGLKERCAGIGPVGFAFHDVLAAWDDPAPLLERFERSASALIAQGADVIIPGEMPLNILLARNGVTRIRDVPILDGIAVTLKLAEALVDLRRSVGLAQSRSGFMSAAPPRERLDQVLAFYGLSR